MQITSEVIHSGKTMTSEGNREGQGKPKWQNDDGRVQFDCKAFCAHTKCTANNVTDTLCALAETIPHVSLEYKEECPNTNWKNQWRYITLSRSINVEAEKWTKGEFVQKFPKKCK